MSDNPAKTLSDILLNAAKQFKGGEYDAALKTLQSNKYADAVNALDPEADKQLKETAANIFEHMGLAASEGVNWRIDDKKMGTTIKAIDFIDRQIAKESLSPLHLTNLSYALGDLVHQIDADRDIQAKLLTQNEADLIKNGWLNYNLNLIGRRWSSPKDIVMPVKEIVEELKETAPEIDLLKGGSFNLGGGNPFEQTPKNNVQTQTILEGRALEEFGGVKILDDNWKKLAAGIAVVAGVGIAAHGVSNVYRAFVHDNQEQLEVAEIGHKPTKAGVNWLRLVVGVAEIGSGGFIAVQHLTGRNPLDIGKPVVGDFTAMCNHGAAPQNGGRGT
jgi:hypothetical protein